MKRGSEEYKKRNREYLKEWRKRHEDVSRKRYAREISIMRIRSETKNRFKKSESCDLCNSKENLEFHHWVYEHPVKKEHFSTLCKSCHIKIHKEENHKNKEKEKELLQKLGLGEE